MKDLHEKLEIIIMTRVRDLLGGKKDSEDFNSKLSFFFVSLK